MSVGTTTAGPSLTAQTAGRPLLGRLAQTGSALRAASGQVTTLAGRGLGTAGRLARAVPRGGYVGAAVGGLDVAGSLIRGDTIGAARASGGVVGTLAGAAAGAAIGSVVPIIGTTIGGSWARSPATTAGTCSPAPCSARPPAPISRHRVASREAGGLAPAALDAAGELDALAAQADAAGRALETLRPAPLDRPYPTIDQRVGRIEIGPITIQSAADDPRDVADAVTDQVVDRVRQALADEQRRLTDTLVADPSPEGAF